MWLFQHQHRLMPTPRRYEVLDGRFVLPDPLRVNIRGLPHAESAPAWQMLREGCEHTLQRKPTLAEDASVSLILGDKHRSDNAPLPAEGYTLRITTEGITLTALDEAGLLYGVQSLVQLIGQSLLYDRPGELSCVLVHDWPHFTHRSVMLDLGRAVFSYDMLERVVRMCCRMKLNVLHLHLHENELNPVRYPDSPLGSENPCALALSDYERLIQYARRFNVQVVPELESWGHVGSLLQHYPQLYGASRPHGQGHSFLICPEMFELLERLYDAWLAILPDGSKLHVGMDEANWHVAPGMDIAPHDLAALVRRVHDLVQQRAAAHGKHIDTMMWTDAGAGAKLGADLRNRIIFEPWCYTLTKRKRDIDELVRTTAMPPDAALPEGKGAAPMVCGMGMAAYQEQGAFTGSRRWLELTQRSPNCHGGDICMWASNDIAGRLLGIYAGAEMLWSPDGIDSWFLPATSHEDIAGHLSVRMKAWQAITPEMQPDDLRAAQGSEVIQGQYRWGPRMGQRPAPLWMPEQALPGDQV